MVGKKTFLIFCLNTSYFCYDTEFCGAYESLLDVIGSLDYLELLMLEKLGVLNSAPHFPDEKTEAQRPSCPQEPCLVFSVFRVSILVGALE